MHVDDVKLMAAVEEAMAPFPLLRSASEEEEEEAAELEKSKMERENLTDDHHHHHHYRQKIELRQRNEVMRIEGDNGEMRQAETV